MINNFFTARCASIIIIAAGYGWAGGHYIPAESHLVAYLFQFLIISAILIFGITYITRPETSRPQSHWSTKGLTIFSALMFLLNVFNIIHGIYATDIHSPGSHNSFADVVPIAVILIGTGLWLLTAFISKKEISQLLIIKIQE